MSDIPYDLTPFMKLPKEYPMDANMGHKIFDRLQAIAMRYIKHREDGAELLQGLNRVVRTYSHTDHEPRAERLEALRDKMNAMYQQQPTAWVRGQLDHRGYEEEEIEYNYPLNSAPLNLQAKLTLLEHILCLARIDPIPQFEKIEDYFDNEVIVYCKMGGRSKKACEVLIFNGFTNVKNLDGGLLNWHDSVSDTVSCKDDLLVYENSGQ